MSGYGDEEGLAEEEGAGRVASPLLIVPLSEVDGQIHLLTVLLLHLIPTAGQQAFRINDTKGLYKLYISVQVKRNFSGFFK